MSFTQRKIRTRTKVWQTNVRDAWHGIGQYLSICEPC